MSQSKHSGQVRGQTLLEATAALHQTPRHHPLAADRFIRHPVRRHSVPVSHAGVLLGGVGGQGSRHRRSLPAAASFFFPFENVLCSFFLLLFFFFLKESLSARHFHQPVTSSPFLVCLTQTTREHSKHAIKCWLF